MQSKLAALQEQINELDQLIQNAVNEDGSRASDSQLTLWEMARSEKRKELEAALQEEAQQQERVQAQVVQIGGLKETIRNIFEAVFPKDEMVKIVGLTEYESTQQTCNQLIDQAVDEDQEGVYVAFNQQLEQRDEKYRLLTLDALEVQRQFEKANQEANHWSALSTQQEQALEKLSEENLTLQRTVSDHDEQLRQRDEEAQRLNQHVFDLQKQIANVQTSPQIIDIIPTIASESLSERIAQAKVNSKLQLANVKAIGANWVEGINAEGNKEVAHVNEVEAVTEFPTIEPVSEVVEPETEQPFPESNQIPNTGHDLAMESSEDNRESDEEETVSLPIVYERPVTFAELQVLQQSHAELTARVSRIEARANIQAVA